MPKNNQMVHNGRESCVCFMILYCISNDFYNWIAVILILVSQRAEVQVIQIFGTESMRRSLAEQLQKQRGNVPSHLEWLIVIYVLGTWILKNLFFGFLPFLQILSISCCNLFRILFIPKILMYTWSWKLLHHYSFFWRNNFSLSHAWMNYKNWHYIQ